MSRSNDSLSEINDKEEKSLETVHSSSEETVTNPVNELDEIDDNHATLVRKINEV